MLIFGQFRRSRRLHKVQPPKFYVVAMVDGKIIIRFTGGKMFELRHQVVENFMATANTRFTTLRNSIAESNEWQHFQEANADRQPATADYYFSIRRMYVENQLTTIIDIIITGTIRKISSFELDKRTSNWNLNKTKNNNKITNKIKSIRVIRIWKICSTLKMDRVPVAIFSSAPHRLPI